jgi:hypothetical protein
MAHAAGGESPLGMAIKKRQGLAALALFFSSQAREVLGDA